METVYTLIIDMDSVCFMLTLYLVIYELNLFPILRTDLPAHYLRVPGAGIHNSEVYSW